MAGNPLVVKDILSIEVRFNGPNGILHVINVLMLSIPNILKPTPRLQYAH